MTASTRDASPTGDQRSVVAAHTPGPWKLHEQPAEFRIREGLDFSIMQSEPLRCLMLLAAPGQVTPEFRANARLITAAPEMLADLRQCKTELEEAVNLLRPYFAGMASIYAHAVERVAATIAKATGEGSPVATSPSNAEEIVP